MKVRDEIAALIMASGRPDAYTMPLPWPMPPGEAPLRGIPPEERDAIERQPTGEGYDANAMQGEDLLRRYFNPDDQEEEA